MELLKNIVYAGVGLATVTTEKVKDTIDDLVEKGMISDTEGKKIIDDFFATTEKRKEEFENKFKTATDKISEKFEFINKEKEIKTLNDKINNLEMALSKAKAEVKKAKNTSSKTNSNNRQFKTKKNPKTTT